MGTLHDAILVLEMSTVKLSSILVPQLIAGQMGQLAAQRIFISISMIVPSKTTYEQMID